MNLWNPPDPSDREDDRPASIRRTWNAIFDSWDKPISVLPAVVLAATGNIAGDGIWQ